MTVWESLAVTDAWLVQSLAGCLAVNSHPPFSFLEGRFLRYMDLVLSFVLGRLFCGPVGLVRSSPGCAFNVGVSINVHLCRWLV